MSKQHRHKCSKKPARAQRKNAGNTAESREAITQWNQRESYFLRLPGELRNRIYELSLTGHEIYLNNETSILHPHKWVGRAPNHQSYWDPQPITQLLALNLPLVCRQVHFEVSPDYVFSNNTFGLSFDDRTFMIGSMGRQRDTRAALETGTATKTILTTYLHDDNNNNTHVEPPTCHILHGNHLADSLLYARSVADHLLRFNPGLQYTDEIEIVKRFRFRRGCEYVERVVKVPRKREGKGGKRRMDAREWRDLRSRIKAAMGVV